MSFGDLISGPAGFIVLKSGSDWFYRVYVVLAFTFTHMQLLRFDVDNCTDGEWGNMWNDVCTFIPLCQHQAPNIILCTG